MEKEEKKRGKGEATRDWQGTECTWVVTIIDIGGIGFKNSVISSEKKGVPTVSPKFGGKSNWRWINFPPRPQSPPQV